MKYTIKLYIYNIIINILYRYIIASDVSISSIGCLRTDHTLDIASTENNVFCGIQSSLQIAISFQNTNKNEIFNISNTNDCLINNNKVLDNPNFHFSFLHYTSVAAVGTFIYPFLSTNITDSTFISFKCSFISQNINNSNIHFIKDTFESIQIITTLPIINNITFLPFESIQLNKTMVYGIGSILKFKINIIPIRKNYKGYCNLIIDSFNKSFLMDTTLSIFQYAIKPNDPYISLNNLLYKCIIYDMAQNKIEKEGTIINSPEIDGRLPQIKDSFIVFTSDQPAKIGSSISIGLRTSDYSYIINNNNNNRSVHTNQMISQLQHETDNEQNIDKNENNPTVVFKSDLSGNCIINENSSVSLFPSSEDIGYYLVTYNVRSGDLDQDERLNIKCNIKNNTNGNINQYEKNIKLTFLIDANEPKVQSVSILYSSENPAHDGTIIEVQIMIEKDKNNKKNEILIAENGTKCFINNVSVGNSFIHSTSNTYLLTYVVGKYEARWKSGKLGINCDIQDIAGNLYHISNFTYPNKLRAIELKPIEESTPNYFPSKKLLLCFLLIVLASRSISKVFPYFGLPRLTGYFLTGIIAGPYVLNLLSSDQMSQLRFIDEISLAYIGISAGSKLHWHQMKSIIRNIMIITCSLSFFEYAIGTLTILFVSPHLEFLQSTSTSEKYVIALLAGCMMIARSPSSMLAVIEENNATGYFTTLTFAVTVFCDLLVIILFNVHSMLTVAILSGKNLSISRIIYVLIQFIISILLGAILGKIMTYILLWRAPYIKRKSNLYKTIQMIKQIGLLMFGFGIFVFSHSLTYLEPLLCCMISGAVLWNLAPSPASSQDLLYLIKGVSSFVYVSFFTLTGAGLELDMLAKSLAVSLLLCGTRIIGIYLGAFIGGKLAGENNKHNNISWMAYLTQAGVTLGLAKKIQLQYPGWGSYFSTFIVAVVICNQIIGPPFLRFVLKYVGDIKKKKKGHVEGLKALIIGEGEIKKDMILNNDTYDKIILKNGTLHQTISARKRMSSCGWKTEIEFISSSVFTTIQYKDNDKNVSKSIDIPTCNSINELKSSSFITSPNEEMKENIFQSSENEKNNEINQINHLQEIDIEKNDIILTKNNNNVNENKEKNRLDDTNKKIIKILSTSANHLYKNIKQLQKLRKYHIKLGINKKKNLFDLNINNSELLNYCLNLLRHYEPLDVIVIMMSKDNWNYQMIQSLATSCTLLKRISVLRVVVSLADDEPDYGWNYRIAEMPFIGKHGDAIDVVLVDRDVATDMLIELAAKGSLANNETSDLFDYYSKSKKLILESKNNNNNNIIHNKEKEKEKKSLLYDIEDINLNSFLSPNHLKNITFSPNNNTIHINEKQSMPM